MLENQFPKALHQDGEENQMRFIIKTGHSRPSRYRELVAVLRQEVLLLFFFNGIIKVGDISMWKM